MSVRDVTFSPDPAELRAWTVANRRASNAYQFAGWSYIAGCQCRRCATAREQGRLRYATRKATTLTCHRDLDPDACPSVPFCGCGDGPLFTGRMEDDDA